MPFCERCGTELNEEAVFCSKCGEPINRRIDDSDKIEIIELATWPQRLIALLIDTVPLMLLLSLISFPSILVKNSFTFSMLRSGFPLSVGLDRIVQFLYFTFMDFYYGKSVGKMVMNIKITKDGGGPLTILDAAIESFGKVFLLPFDFIIGYFIYKNKNQRLFNYLSDTVVIREL